MRSRIIISYAKTHKLGLTLLGLIILTAMLCVSASNDSFLIIIRDAHKETHYEKQTFPLLKRKPGFLHYSLSYKLNHNLPMEGVRDIFTQYHGLEIFVIEICNARHQCETHRAIIDNAKYEANPFWAKGYDSKGYVGSLGKRLEFNNTSPIGRQNYFVTFNPVFMEKIIPYYSFYIEVNYGPWSNIILRNYVVAVRTLIFYVFYYSFSLIPFSLVALPALLVCAIYGFYLLLKPRSRR
jgi:hypothetical protein